jgi:hypothetical protein
MKKLCHSTVSSMVVFILAVMFVILQGTSEMYRTEALALVPNELQLPPTKRVFTAAPVTRTSFLQSLCLSGVLAAVGGTPAAAQGTEPAIFPPKKERISEEELKRIVTADVVERAFLVSADLTRDIYEENASFTDEIDTYSISQWISGTKKLFVSEGSRVTLVGDVQVTPETVQFQFDEELMFRIPFRPVVSLSGYVVLTRNPVTGLISSYTEHWDQDVLSVLKTAKLKK